METNGTGVSKGIGKHSSASDQISALAQSRIVKRGALAPLIINDTTPSKRVAVVWK